MIERLKQLRAEKGISQQELANFLGCNQQSINSYENPGSEPNYQMLAKIADYFSTTVDYLIGHSDIRYPYGPAEVSDATVLEHEIYESVPKLSVEFQRCLLGLIKEYLKKSEESQPSA